MRLTSLEWSPYVSKVLPGDGMTANIVRTAAQTAGLRTEISYFPWSRAVQDGLNSEQFDGYFPAFYLKEREKNCYFSGSLGNSVIGFASLSDTHFDWENLKDLKKYKIGTVHEYANGEVFDAMVRQKQLLVDSAPSDISNLRKLLAKRVDVIVIDKWVYKSLLISDLSLGPDKQHIVFHPKELTQFSMHICFQRNAKGQAKQKAFNTGLEKLQVKKMEAQYFQQLQLSVSEPTWQLSNSQTKF
ncbi:transporter substrate-binding domain-containing protein [Undibacterium sp. CY7W]|uniref:Transporter substrate-binding domain-containing protein n=1 Tax=Undibacterium rugosum TaxID=2762291 RepID=A0A923HXB8_9BURK|nr:transporter substrate-binding domain-containing protein [Undibacterium rugosum]